MSYIIISLVLVSIFVVIIISIYSRKKSDNNKIPHWANKQPLRISYNKYKYEGNLQGDRNLPSGRLLFESINSMKAKNALIEIDNALEINKEFPFIWSCSLENGKIKWELRLHLYNYINNDYRNVDKVLPIEFVVPHKNTIAVSFDIHNKTDSLGEKYHFFNANYGQVIKCPFKGYISFIKGDDDVFYKEANFIYDSKVNFIKNKENYLKEIGIKKNIDNLLNLYKNCEELCVSLKFDKYISIIYIGVTIDDFINLLKKFDYPETFINHVVENKEKYRNIKHEISITYDLELRPISSSFYGII